MISVRILLTSIFMMAATVAVNAQEEPEYRLELGAGVGLLNSIGDFNGSLTKNMQPWITAIAKYRMNPRMAVAFNIGTGKVKGSTDGVKTWYPIERYEYNHRLTEADLRFEYNFWAYGTGKEYRGARPFVPFITLGLGATFFGGEKSGITANLPVGVGIKYKVAKRLNLSAEWVMRFTLSDYLDGRADIYGIKSSGLFKNADCYHVLQLSVTYDLWTKCPTCNNDD